LDGLTPTTELLKHLVQAADLLFGFLLVDRQSTPDTNGRLL
jgi:hypothetical protein